nr:MULTISPECIES: GPGG-motif small membrane protein [Allobranchiibius]
MLWILAVILVIAGIVVLLKGSIILGIVLIVVGLAVGPGGWSVLSKR